MAQREASPQSYRDDSGERIAGTDFVRQAFRIRRRLMANLTILIQPSAPFSAGKDTARNGEFPQQTRKEIGRFTLRVQQARYDLQLFAIKLEQVAVAQRPQHGLLVVKRWTKIQIAQCGNSGSARGGDQSTDCAARRRLTLRECPENHRIGVRGRMPVRVCWFQKIPRSEFRNLIARPLPHQNCSRRMRFVGLQQFRADAVFFEPIRQSSAISINTNA